MSAGLTARRLVLGLLGCALVLAVAVGVSLLLGSVRVDPAEVWAALRDPSRRPGNLHYTIVIGQRLPRVLLGLLVGGGLGLCGASFQALLRNPLADPYTLGVASGSALGASLALAAKWSLQVGPFGGVQVAALLGGLAVTAVIWRIGVVRREFRVESLLLGGVTVALVTSSAIIVIRTLADPHFLVTLDRWLLGSLAAALPRDSWSLLPFLLVGGLPLLALGPAFNQLALGEELAHGRGINAGRVQVWTFLAASLVTAGTVSVAGPIGFVGLIVPHAVRSIWGPDHRLLLPGSALVAGGFLLLCDTLARTVVAPTEMPVGVVTAVIGGPVFLLLLWRRR